MVVWSSICRVGNIFGKTRIPGTPGIFNTKYVTPMTTIVRNGSGDRTMKLTPTRHQWNKFKDLVHYYILVGVIPLSLLVFYCNVFIGPATLEPIPEGYTPKYWEYHRHPITRFIARYLQHSPQQDYEKFMHFIFEEEEKKQLTFLERKIKKKMAENEDYQSYYFKPLTARYLRAYKKSAEELRDTFGDT